MIFNQLKKAVEVYKDWYIVIDYSHRNLT